MIATIVQLTCRGCGTISERKLNLPEGVAPPATFTCAGCNAARSIADTLSDEEIVRHRLTKRTPRADEAAARLAKAHPILPWPERNPFAQRARLMFRVDRFPDLRRGTRRETAECRKRLLEAFLRNVESAGWKCVFCRAPLTDKTAQCCRVTPGDNSPANLQPTCRTCNRRHSAQSRYTKRRRAA